MFTQLPFAAVAMVTCFFAATPNAFTRVTCSTDASPREDTASLVLACIGDDAEKTQQAIAALRAAGQPGLDALCNAHELFAHAATDSLCSLPGSAPMEANPTITNRLRNAIDSVAMQRDAHASRLYWFTDFNAAMAQASASGKPILSLRLLGNLNDDLSCANSRFFRSVLYANAQVSDYLREHYILHWESLRPVPRLTIDFGDGRRIERTITGNSIHYVLDSNGAIIDAIPGLYGPTPFLLALQSAENAHITARAITDQSMRGAFLRDYHAQAIVRIDDQLRSDFAAIGIMPNGEQLRNAAAQNQLKAIPAAAVAPSKMRAEVKAIHAALDAPAAIADSPDDANARWTRIAALHADDADLDARSIELIASKSPTALAIAAQQSTATKGFDEDPMMRMLGAFRQSLATDSVRNEFDLHRTIHLWLSQSAPPAGDAAAVRTFNERVYVELFLTPLDDPWMGLAPRDAYAAIDSGGLVDACAK